MRLWVFIILLMAYIPPVYAYIGPGMGGGAISAILGVIGSIFLALFGILYYPIKRLFKKKKKSRERENKT